MKHQLSSPEPGSVRTNPPVSNLDEGPAYLIMACPTLWLPPGTYLYCAQSAWMRRRRVSSCRHIRRAVGPLSVGVMNKSSPSSKSCSRSTRGSHFAMSDAREELVSDSASNLSGEMELIANLLLVLDRPYFVGSLRVDDSEAWLDSSLPPVDVANGHLVSPQLFRLPQQI